jgi:hypothetical protein
MPRFPLTLPDPARQRAESEKEFQSRLSNGIEGRCKSDAVASGHRGDWHLYFLTANKFYHHYCKAAAERVLLGMPKSVPKARAVRQ